MKPLSASIILDKKQKPLSWKGKWADAFGYPPKTGNWIIYGDSGHGKSVVAMQLAKYLTQFGRVGYNTLEELTGISFVQNMRVAEIDKSIRQFLIYTGYNIIELHEHLIKKKSPDFVFIDTIQYLTKDGTNACDSK